MGNMYVSCICFYSALRDKEGEASLARLVNCFGRTSSSMNTCMNPNRKLEAERGLSHGFSFSSFHLAFLALPLCRAFLSSLSFPQPPQPPIVSILLLPFFWIIKAKHRLHPLHPAGRRESWRPAPRSCRRRSRPG